MSKNCIFIKKIFESDCSAVQWKLWQFLTSLPAHSIKVLQLEILPSMRVLHGSLQRHQQNRIIKISLQTHQNLILFVFLLHGCLILSTGHPRVRMFSEAF